MEISSDEQPRNARPDKIPHLKPAFKKDGTVTAANASSISDGAAALVLTRESVAEREGLEIRAYINGHASHAHEPGWFTTAPVPAAKEADGENRLVQGRCGFVGSERSICGCADGIYA